MPKHVVLGREHEQHHHKDAWHQFEGLVVVLVACHALAFLFWAWLLYKTRDSRSKAGPGAAGKAANAARRGAGAGGGAGGSGTAAGRSPAKKGIFEWRTPREILAQQKAKIGKV